MFRIAWLSSVLCVSCVAMAAEDGGQIRPITKAKSIIAVYREDWGLLSAGEPGIILAAWPDGNVVWSANQLKGGTPYFQGHVEPKRIAALIQQFDKDGLFDDSKLNQSNFGPDSQFITLFIKAGRKSVKMGSWHELFEDSGKLVVDHNGVSSLEGRRRLDILRKAPADYLFFRLVWSETRAKITDLIPAEKKKSIGKPMMKAGVLAWQEPAIGLHPKKNANDTSDR
jgi:hypothetical protein